jgi:magnesium transporter
MYELAVCTSDGKVEVRDNTSKLEFDSESKDTVLWLDLIDPDEEDYRTLQEKFHFHPLAIEDTTRRHQRPKVESYTEYYFVVFYRIEVAENTRRLVGKPLYLFIGANYLVTIHRVAIPQIQETLRRWRDPNSPLGQDLGALVYALLDALVDDYFPVIDEVAERIEDLEEKIFEEFDENALQNIFNLKKDLLSVRRVVAPERDVLNVMLRREIPVFDEHDVAYLQDVYDHIVRIIDSLDTYRDLLSSALDTFLSVQSNRLNQVVKALTITSIILMSVTLVAGIYGMNFKHMPELDWRYGYAWALGLMVLISASLILWFRRIKWL